jgi:hypothetical protein
MESNPNDPASQGHRFGWESSQQLLLGVKSWPLQILEKEFRKL